MALLIAFTFSGAAARFDSRRQLVVEESNCIGTAYLRIDLLREIHRARDIGEEHGDELALPLEGAPRGEDLIGEVFWGVRAEVGSDLSGGRRSCAACLGDWLRKRHPAPAAELVLGRILVLAGGAGHRFISIQRGTRSIGITGGAPPTRISRITSKPWRRYRGTFAGFDDSR